MPPKRRFKADPYDVLVLQPNGEAGTFGDLLSVLEAMPLIPAKGMKPSELRWGAHGSSVVTVDRLVIGKPTVGTVYVGRGDDLPHAGGPTVGIIPLQLETDQWVGKHVAFLWDEQAEVFWFQRDPHSVGLGMFKDYLMDRTGWSVTITPKLSKDALKRWKKVRYVKRLDIAFRQGKDRGAIKGAEATIDDIVRIQERHDIGTVEVIFRPHRGKFLSADLFAVIHNIGRMAFDKVEQIKGAKILGYSEYDENKENHEEIINLLRDKMHFETDVPASRFRNPDALMLAMRTLWREFKDKV